MKKYILISLLLLCCNSTWAQSYFYNNRYYDSPLLLEAGGFMGAMNCYTDIAGKGGRGLTRFCGGGFAGLLYEYRIGVRLQVTSGQVAAADSVLKNVRNLSFRSTIREILLLVDFHPLSLFTAPGRFSPFLLAGIGFFAFNPQGYYNGRWVDLQPLRTEGQGFPAQAGNPPYKRNQVNYPLGMGVRCELSALLHAKLEMIYRFLQTDYLDDVSQNYIDPVLFHTWLSAPVATLAEVLADKRMPGALWDTKRGNPLKNDGYVSLQLTISLILNRKRR